MCNGVKHMFDLNAWQQLIGIVIFGGVDLWCMYRAIEMKYEKDYEL